MEFLFSPRQYSDDCIVQLISCDDPEHCLSLLADVLLHWQYCAVTALKLVWWSIYLLCRAWTCWWEAPSTSTLIFSTRITGNSRSHMFASYSCNLNMMILNQVSDLFEDMHIKLIRVAFCEWCLWPGSKVANVLPFSCSTPVLVLVPFKGRYKIGVGLEQNWKE